MLITALRNDVSRPGKRLKNRPDETKRDERGPSAKRYFLFCLGHDTFSFS